MSITQFTTMEDAYYYFFQAKGTPNSRQGTAVKERHLRTAALLGWVAVDDAVAAFATQRNLVWPKDCKGSALFPKVRFIWGKLQQSAPDRDEFNRHRRLRNKIAHPTGAVDAAVDVAAVEEILAFCKTTIRVMYPKLVIGEEWKGRLSEVP